MRFGIGPFAAEEYKDISSTEAYEIMTSAVQAAEDMGFHSAWVTERYFSEDGYCPSAFISAAYLAARTSAIRICVMPIVGLTHPLYIAEDTAVLDNLSAGRVTFVPINAAAHEMEAYGVAEKEYEERYLESIDVFFKSWASTPFSFKGKHWTIPAQLEGHVENKSGTVNVTPNPAQPQIPVWIGGFSEFARKVAGDLGLPMVLGAISKNQDAGKFFSEHEVKVQTRVANNPRILIRDVYVSNSANPMAECQEMLERQFVRYKNWKLWDGEIDNFAELAKGRFIIGTPEEVIDQIRYLEDNFGIDQLVCRMHFPGMPLHQLLKSMQLFSSDVIPEFAMPNLPSQIRLGI